ncbi:MAG: WD40 repeat domain-containing protein [Gemmataceae bacterium]|nr:WD40 repeat domain-containing protein [Gemmataceae bacterium]
MVPLRLVVLAFAVVGLLYSPLSAQEAKKQPIPMVQDQTKADALIQELYANEFKETAKHPGARQRLAMTLLQEARDTTDLPAGKYRLLTHARDLAVSAGDLAVASQAIQELTEHFDVSESQALAMRVRAANDAIQSLDRTDSNCRTVFDMAVTLFDEALAVEDFPMSAKALEAADTAGRKLRNVLLVAQVRDRKDSLTRVQAEFAKWRPYAEKLVKNPKDREANVEMGKYYALLRGNWSAGLPLLSQGSDIELAGLAKSETNESPKAGDSYVLGMKWAALSGKLPIEFRDHARARAYHWLAKALPEADAASEPKIQEKLDELGELLPTALRIGELDGESRRCDGHLGSVYSVAFATDGQRLLSAGADQTIRLWDSRTGKELRRIDAPIGRIWTVVFAPRGKYAASGSFDGSVRLWDLERGREVRRFSEKGDYVRSVVFSADGQSIAAAGDDRVIRIWDVATGKLQGTLKGHDHFVWSIAFSRDGKHLVSGSLDRTIRIWDLTTMAERKTISTGDDSVFAIAMSPDGRRFASGSSDRHVQIWDLATGERVRTLAGHEGYVHSIAYSPDGRRILSGSQDQTLRLWEVRTGRQLRTLEGHRDQVWSVAFSPDGKRAASGSDDRGIRIWSGR